MEANREEAERCVEIARKYIVEGNVEKAKKFLNKAQKLCPSQRARNLLDQMEDSDEKTKTANGSAHRDYFNSAFFDHYNERPEPRSRFHTSRSQPRFSHAASEDDASSSSSSSSANASYASDPSAETNAPQSKRGRSRSTDKNRTQPQRTTSSPQLGVDYTKEELEAVNRIRHCKDYYEILNVSKEFTEVELKKSYRKLALQFHPDKCRCPGATEAFKAIGNAYAVLSDKEKRERYDMYGSEQPPPSRRRNSGFYEYDYSRGFEGDFTPEEIFNMFFGGGFPTGQVYRRRGPGGTTYYYQHSADHGAERNDSGFGVALQLLPILVLLFLSLASQFFIGEPAYSMHRTNKYTVERHTSDLRVPYYVKQDFLKQYRGNVHRVEQQVEEDYISNLRMNCYRERSQKEALAWRARTYGDSQLWEKAQHLPTPNCDRLNDIYS